MKHSENKLQSSGTSGACETCPVYHAANLKKMGVNTDGADYIVALAGNPNTGKSTVFNALTGLKQHTGNWPGKTVARAEGGFSFRDKFFRLVDLPGVYSLLSTSTDEQIARDFVLFGRPDVTVVVTDASRLERSLLLAVQVMEITSRVVVCVNLTDEATKEGITIDARTLARELGVPVALTAARSKEGFAELLDAIHGVATGAIECSPKMRIPLPANIEQAVTELESDIRRNYPSLPNARWVALRLLEGDDSVETALNDGTLGILAHNKPSGEMLLPVLQVGAA